MIKNDDRPGEYKLVTILFADIVGSTELAGEQDAETTRLVLDRCLRIMSSAIDKFGGTVARLTGDGLLAFFGAPRAHEDDPERAALAARAMHAGIESYGEELRQPLQIRVGINTGRVVMGEVGGKELSEYTAMGPPIHLAARLQSAAEPGSTLVGETTYRLILQRFQGEPVSDLELKGFKGPQRGYLISAPRAEAEYDRTIGYSPGTPFVGRERELGPLRELTEGLKRGRGAIAALIGEPGVGKSRLLYEVRSAAGDREITWAEGRAYSYTQDQPHGVIRDLLQELLDLNPDDTPAMLDLKLERSLTPLFGEKVGEVWPFLAELLGAPLPPAHSHQVDNLKPEQLSLRISESLNRTLVAMAGQQPLAISFDDLHWADPSSLDWIESLFYATEQSPLLLLLMFRPERDKQVWDLKSSAEREYGHRFREIRLEPLDDRAASDLIAGLLPDGSMSPEIAEFIRNQAEGNPFFVEELVRGVVEGLHAGEAEMGVAVAREEQLRLPETLQELIQARIDRLPRPERGTLQAASVIGRRFAYPVLESVAPADGELPSRLLHLQRTDLIRERARIPEPEYIFKHTIVHEMTYHSILGEQRRALHKRAGETLESLYSDRLPEYAGRIAHHYQLAGQDEKAFQYEKIAAETADRLYANAEAAGHYQRAIELALHSGQHGDDLKSLFTRAGRALELSADHHAAEQHYLAMAKYAQEAGRDDMLLAAKQARITLLVTPTRLMDHQTGRELVEEALPLAQRLGDREAEASLQWSLCLLSRYQGDLEASIQHGEKSLELSRDLGLTEQVAFTLTDLYWSYISAGELDQARRANQESSQIWEESNNLPMVTDSLASRSALFYLRGEFDRALASADRAYELSQEIDNLWGLSFSRLYSALIYIDRGETEKGFEQMQESLQLSLESGFSIPQVFLPAVRAFTRACYGDPLGALEDYDVQEPPVAGIVTFTKIIRHFVRASLLAQVGELEEAREELRQARESRVLVSQFGLIWPTLDMVAAVYEALGDHQTLESIAIEQRDQARAAGARPNLLESLLVLGRSLVSQGKTEQARPTLEEGLAIADEIGHRRHSWQLHELLARVAQADGDAAQAAKHQELAREAIEFLSEHLPDQRLRTAFHSMPRVRKILMD